MSVSTPVALTLKPSSHRAIPLRARPDLRIEEIAFRNIPTWVVKDPVTLTYHRLRGEQYFVLSQLDGRQSLDEIRRKLQKQYPHQHILLTDIQQIITALSDLGLVINLNPGHAASRLAKQKEKQKQQLLSALQNVLYFRLPGWDPEQTLNGLYPNVRLWFHPLAVAMVIAFVAGVSFYSVVQFDEFAQQLPEFRQFFGWPNWLYLWLTLGIAKVIHEFGHGLACKHYGGECHEMGLMLLVFSPCLYCDVTDAWMLKSKWQRIAIAAAGMYVEVFLSAIALSVWWWTQPGLVHHLALNIFFVTSLTTVIFNINPLMRYDGYYMLADWLEIPNLRPQAEKHVRNWIGQTVFGIEPAFDPFAPQGRQIGFLIYAVLATVYRWVILASILIFLYTVLKPYELQSIGIGLAIVSISSILVGGVLQMKRLLSAPRDEPLKHGRWIVSLSLFAALVLGIGLIPIPWHLHAPFLLEPVDGQHLFVTTPGQLAEVKAEAGKRVIVGQPLVQLVNPELEDRRHQLLIDEKRYQANIDLFFALRNVGQEEIAREMLASTQRELKELKHRISQLSIAAPVSGMLIPASRIGEPAFRSQDRTLGTWHGTPFDEQNVGCYLEQQTHLASIAPSDQFHAVLFIDQAHRNEIQVGRNVELKLENRPGLVLTGHVKQISDHQTDFAPLSLSVKTGGSLPTTTDAQQREKLTSTAYQAVVEFDTDANIGANEALISGMRGDARFLVEQHSLATWIWRSLRRLFHFRL